MKVEYNQLAFALAPVAAPALAIPESPGDAGQGAVYEVSPASTALAEDISSHIAAQGGAALIVDYGHNGAGFGETLQALAKHKPAPLLEAPGSADLSAHVDFLALAARARSAGAEVYGPTGQGDFLEDLGLVHRAEQLCIKNPNSAEDIRRAVARLVTPEEMGTLFKALAIVPKNAPKPPGF